MEEMVVLVDQANNVLGEMPKSLVHTDHTPLHRAFSVFIFNPQREVLLQQRSHSKKTWPMIWSGSCCGHPALHEANSAAVKRRVQYELGIPLQKIHEILPQYSYRAVKDGIVEHEISPVFIAFTLEQPQINPDEVEAIRWVAWDTFLQEVDSAETEYSAWCIEETHLLEQSEVFHTLLT